MIGEPGGFSRHASATIRDFPQPSLPTKVPLDKGPEHGVTGPEAWLVAEIRHFRNLGQKAMPSAVSFAKHGTSTTGNPLLELPIRSVYRGSRRVPLSVFLRASYSDNISSDSS